MAGWWLGVGVAGWLAGRLVAGDCWLGTGLAGWLADWLAGCDWLVVTGWLAVTGWGWRLGQAVSGPG